MPYEIEIITGECRPCGGSWMGTEHVYVTIEAWDRGVAAWNMMVDIYAKHGTDFGLKIQ